MGKVVKGVTGGVKSIGKGIGNVAGGAVKVASSAVKGESLDKGFDRMGGGINTATTGYIDMVTYGQGDMIDKYTGGTVSKLKKSYNAYGNIVAGKSATEEIKQTASNMLDAGKAYIGAKGFNVGGIDMTNTANTVLGGVQNKFLSSDSSQPQPQNLNPANYAPSMQSGSYGGQVAQKNYTPFIVVGAIILVGIVFVIKKKK